MKMNLPRPKEIKPSPLPLSLPDTKVLDQTLQKFLPVCRNTKRLRSTVIRNLEGGCLVWTGKAYREFGLTFRKKSVRTLRELMFVDRDGYLGVRGRIREVKLGMRSILYLAELLAPHGLIIGMAVPPNDYD